MLFSSDGGACVQPMRHGDCFHGPSTSSLYFSFKAEFRLARSAVHPLCSLHSEGEELAWVLLIFHFVLDPINDEDRVF